MTSLGSTNDDTQTCPSIDEEAIYIWFEGIEGTWAWRGVRGDEVWPVWEAVCRDGVSGWSVGLLAEDACIKGCEASKGDTDRDVTEADGCAL